MSYNRNMPHLKTEQSTMKLYIVVRAVTLFDSHELPSCIATGLSWCSLFLKASSTIGPSIFRPRNAPGALSSAVTLARRG